MKTNSEKQPESSSNSSSESDAESHSINSKNQTPDFNESLNNTSVDDTTDVSDNDELSYEGDHDGESATDDESIIDFSDCSNGEEDDEEEQEIDSLTKGAKNTVLLAKANISQSDGNEISKDITAPSKQQVALANVLGSLLKKKKSVVELMNKPKLISKETKTDLTTGNNKTKRKQHLTENVLEIVGEDGKIEKVKIDPKPSKKRKVSTDETKEIAEPGKIHFPANSRTDPYCQDPSLDTDVVKEKRLRSLATQGVVQLFNTLEQFRQQAKDMAAAKGGKAGGYTAPRHPEVSAITSNGKAGLIDFLMKKGKGGGGLPFKKADRPLFSETKRDEGPLESR